MYLKTLNKNECCGCRACAEICVKKCIEMKEDAEGFVFPTVHTENCVHCGLCERVCPVYFDGFSEFEDEAAWAGIHKSSEVVFNSSSGGAFSAIYTLALEQGFRVYGVAFDEALKVKHLSAVTAEECNAFRKSKYVLSDTNGCFSKVSQGLQDGEKIFFAGAPCQCAALIRFLQFKNIDTENLLVADIICHGAPSQKVFDSYREEIEKTGKVGNLLRYTFRNKEKVNGKTNSRSAKLEFSGGEKRTVDATTDSFLRGYYARLFYRSACGHCRFAKPERVSDITLGDAWGITSIFSEWDPLQGVSLILANTPKGEYWVQGIKPHMELRPVTMDWAVSANEQLRCPTKVHPNRAVFFKLWPRKGFAFAVNRAIRGSFAERVMRKIKTLLKKQ